MVKRDSENQKHRRYIKLVRITATLLDGPRSLEEVVHRTYSYLIPLRLFKTTERQMRDQRASVKEKLEDLIACGWIVGEGEQYAITELGRAQVNQRLSELGETGGKVREFFQPQTVSKVTLVVHLVLAALKLPAALLSGSVGLLNDALDTLLDGFSSLLVYLGIRFMIERIVNIILVMLMLAVGLLTFYEAGRRLFVPFEPEVDWFAFLATILSAVVCLVLWFYQRYVGLRSGILALITQSVDSRNHVIIAASVTTGLVASIFRFPLLDTLVGLGVAMLILKSTIELMIETIRSLGKEEIDLSRFEFGMAVPLRRFFQSQLRDWILYLVDQQGIVKRPELVARVNQALDFNQIPAMRAMELTQGQSQSVDLIERSLAELCEQGWLIGEEPLRLTDAGRKRLDKFI